MIINTGLLTKGLRSEFFDRFNPADAATNWRRLTLPIPSNAKQEVYAIFGSLPQMREWGTGRLARGIGTETYTVTNGKYESTIEVDRDEISDDQTGQIRFRVQQMAQAAAEHKEVLIEDLFNHGADAGYLAYDGQRFFSATHASNKSGNQSNLTTPAMAGAAPTSAEFKAGFEAARAVMAAYKNDQGDLQRIRTSGLAVVVPPALEGVANEALRAVIIGGTTNVIQQADIIVLPGLSSGVTGFVCKLDDPLKPFIFQDREQLEFAALDTPTSDESFRREKYLYGVRARYKMTYGQWKYCIRMVFTHT